MIDKAKRAKFMPSAPMQLLLFLCVFGICNLPASIPPYLYSVFRVLTERADLFMSAAIDMEVLLAEIEEIMSSPGYLLVSLFSTVFVLAGVLFYVRKVERRGYDSMGIVRHGTVRNYLLGLAVGLVMFTSVILICYLTGAATFDGFDPSASIGMIVLFFFGYLIQGAEEEVLMRGYLLTGLGTRMPVYAAIIANSVIFAGLHMGNNGFGILPIANLILFGLFVSLYFLRTENLMGVCAIHSVWNFAQGNLFGCSVSGMAKVDSIFQSSMNDAKTLINGGEFGPEGGLAVSIVLVAAILLVLLIPERSKRTESSSGAEGE